MNNLLVSVSGGRTSAYLAQMVKRSEKYKGWRILFCYANTGKERQETLDFLVQCDNHFELSLVWVEAVVHYGEREASTSRVVTYDTASRDGRPFEDVIKKYGIPNSAFPHCTRELKMNPIHHFARSFFDGPYVTAIGIRADEARRIRISDEFIYPLVECGIRMEHIRRYWNSMPFDLRLKDYEGNCDLCWKKSKRKLLTLLKDRPQDAEWWQRMERDYSGFTPPSRPITGPAYFGRKNTPIESFIEESRGYFLPVHDPFWKSDRSSEMDSEEPCNCMVQEIDMFST